MNRIQSFTDCYALGLSAMKFMTTQQMIKYILGFTGDSDVGDFVMVTV